MPLYNYVCPKCGHSEQIRHKMADEPEVECPKCSKAKLERGVVKNTFALKGSGWAKDNYT